MLVLFRRPRPNPLLHEVHLSGITKTPSLQHAPATPVAAATGSRPSEKKKNSRTLSRPPPPLGRRGRSPPRPPSPPPPRPSSPPQQLPSPPRARDCRPHRRGRRPRLAVVRAGAPLHIDPLRLVCILTSGKPLCSVLLCGAADSQIPNLFRCSSFKYGASRHKIRWFLAATIFSIVCSNMHESDF